MAIDVDKGNVRGKNGSFLSKYFNMVLDRRGTGPGVFDPKSKDGSFPNTFGERNVIKSNRNAFPVVDNDRHLVGIISLTDVRRALESGDVSRMTVADAMTSELVTAFPDEGLDTVLRRMAPRDLSRLPVVTREDPKKLAGVIRRNDVVRAYNLGVARRGRAPLGIPAEMSNSNQVGFIELVLPVDSPCIGRSVAEFSSTLPDDSLLVSIRRADGNVVFPRGKTLFQPGDCIVAYSRKEQLDALKRCFGQKP